MAGTPDYGLYDGSILAGVNGPIHDTRGLINLSRVITEKLVSMQVSEDRRRNAIESAVMLGLPVVVDKGVNVDTKLFGKFSFTRSDFLIKSLPDIGGNELVAYADLQGLMLDVGVLLPIHIYQLHPTLGRIQRRPINVQCILLDIPPDEHTRRIHSRTKQVPWDVHSNNYRALASEFPQRTVTELSVLQLNSFVGCDFIFAPPGSGKTTFVSSLTKPPPSLAHMLVNRCELTYHPAYLDGDTLVPWPQQDMMRSMTRAQRVLLGYAHLSMLATIASQLRMNGWRPKILFNPDHDLLPHFFRRYCHGHSAIMPATPCGMWDSLLHETYYKLFGPTFGLSPGLIGRMASWAQVCGLTQLEWKSLVRIWPSVWFLMRYRIPHRVDCTMFEGRRWLSVIYLIAPDGTEVEFMHGGHMLNALLRVVFPILKGESLLYNWTEFFTANQANAKYDVPSFEPTYRGTAWHSWAENACGIISSYVAVRLILKRLNISIPTSGPQFDALRLYHRLFRRLWRNVLVTERTSLHTKRVGLRDADPRFGS